MKRYTIKYTAVITRSIDAESAEDAAALARKHVLRATDTLLGVYPADYMPESPPNNFTPKPPTGPTPGTPVVSVAIPVDQIARAA